MNDNDTAANTSADVECKRIVEVSIHALIHEIEEHVSYGWRYDPKNPPMNMFAYFEVWLYKDRASINRVRDRIDSVIGARADNLKEKQSENVQLAAETTKQRTKERKQGKTAQAMQASLEGVKDEGTV